ncbi:hypothetical protein [Pseudidiomarina sp.]|uniref:hypothetical protein n=1 Tax=Pseudidiomarina sp. TaxID=2081707 RepID=UPI00299DD0C0|nr:hypothetical protein [Pseudidiomarina sp.]MDX1706077.1 hypothetical protein [Pseudidiomarina sp.]
MNTKLATIFVAAALTLSSNVARADAGDSSQTLNYLSEALTQQVDSVTTELANATRYALQQTLTELKLAFSSAEASVEVASVDTKTLATDNKE